ncbi:MAG: sensor histidine kinase, partial [Proteobacteria bacterium]|nr:sensor histidine kinase [Pseudomonadota bacterium]
NLFSSYGVSRDRIRLELDIERTEVVVDTAIPCGLIINELVTNALKHAFPNGREGSIKVTFKRKKSDGYLLEVKDDGVGLSRDLDVCRAGSLGLQLVVILLEQLKGKLKIDSRGGATFRMEFDEYFEAGAMLY